MANVYQDAGAVISDDLRYRWRLWRAWSGQHENSGFVLWIMLNPSTATGNEDDATIRKCVGFAKRWGFSSIEVANLFSFRATNSALLSVTADPVGPQTNAYVSQLVLRAREIVVGWGDSGPAELMPRRVADVQALCAGRTVHCIGRTKSGAPRHPSRPGYATPREVYWR